MSVALVEISRSKVTIMEIVVKFPLKLIIELSWIVTTLTVLVRFFSFHPLMLCLGLISLTLAVRPLIGLIIRKWIAYTIILIFLGGIIVLFIYVSTLASNEKLVFFYGNSPYFAFLMLGLFFLPLNDTNVLLISHLYLNFSVSLLFFLTLYLLFTLISVIFLSQGFKGALITHT